MAGGVGEFGVCDGKAVAKLLVGGGSVVGVVAGVAGALAEQAARRQTPAIAPRVRVPTPTPLLALVAASMDPRPP